MALRVLPFAAILALLPGWANAHFQELLPENDILAAEGNRIIALSAVFTHPTEGGPAMDMARPMRLGVIVGGKRTDLTATLAATVADGKKAYGVRYQATAPGDHVFFLEPAPYWEAAEKHYLVHYTKVVVDFASGGGWDALAGLPMEIMPLTRPYGLYTGNLFRGIALKNGKPLAFATVEVAWVNDGSVKVTSDAFATQVVKTDAAGVFAYAMPHAGWWGFNALSEGKIKGPDGKLADAELGGTIWVKAVDFK